jgi:hypothetical protein
MQHKLCCWQVFAILQCDQVDRSACFNTCIDSSSWFAVWICLSASRIVSPLLALNAIIEFLLWRCRIWETIKKWSYPCTQLIKHHAMNTWRSGGTAPPFLTSTLDGGEWSASCPGCFTPGERSPGTHFIGGWVGPRACSDAVEKRKILPLPGFEPRASSP